VKTVAVKGTRIRGARGKRGRGARAVRGGSGMALLVVLGTALTACASAPPLPQTRSVITITGERVQADPEAMVEVDAWLRPQMDDIDRNPSFLIRILQEDRATYPWQNLELIGDTAQVTVEQGQGDAETPFLVYAHFRLMEERGELEPWLPEAFPEEGPPLEGFARERAMLVRIADLWLLGRAVFDTTPYGPLDELLYANETGFLDEFIYATQAERFAAESAAHFAENPGRADEFRQWFQRVFEADGPRYLVDLRPEAPVADSVGLSLASPSR
jgi:hypothetical protein